MSELAVAVAIGGPLAVAGGWVIVRSRRASLWLVNGTLLPALGIAALASGEVRATGGHPVGGAVLWGIAAGLVLYAATRAFMAIAGRWPTLARHAEDLYGSRADVSFVVVLGVSLLLAAPAEELLWRGAILPVLGSWTGSAPVAAALAWGLYVVANAASGSVPIVLGAIVGGAAWTALGLAGGGVAAPIACHVVWTGLMLGFPPIRSSR